MTSEARKNVFQWQRSNFIRKIDWSPDGLRLGLLDSENGFYFVLPNKTQIQVDLI